MTTIPTLTHGRITIRPLRLRDTRDLDMALSMNRSWLRTWEATNPSGLVSADVRGSIRALQANARAGLGLPFAMELDGRFVGQLNVSGISYGSLASASIGYWVVESAAGHNVTPTAVALATDHCFRSVGIHRVEICIRPENAPSLRVVEKLGFRYEGLRRRYIHINGDWRDHFCFALVAEEVREGVLDRWVRGAVPAGQGSVPDQAREEAAMPIATSRRG
ncbi:MULTISPECIES: GNAT family N-acetyltransferase [unclassified Curtobacterium]|uniref:GNAT family N-acetyltransferase n=1 Tax=unclassified Curtobacterium TaxID=257496 RepID=UPI000DA92738|nr:MULTISPECIES: GNAT family protein [unclassified Curtobacterium]PZE23356.1 GNAT family N-acetyltransferase [Curtobacterium sp. MCBD17_028]PZE74793.1 GNAT family N-acetyltransferase [Curtobacterium sp. MCBD17_019]PZF60387.1 GNAT family N-acetyltransferase [Curtobacterium sp. MCBD17_034]PZF62721.1 GNAT family N-acetyltransferase [Curtobacterium sp. MCBD17_013]PZM35073.1 GNAT family N-acetyltransferase [Curtobacterium sp. MCBD17_031]